MWEACGGGEVAVGGKDGRWTWGETSLGEERFTGERERGVQHEAALGLGCWGASTRGQRQTPSTLSAR